MSKLFSKIFLFSLAPWLFLALSSVLKYKQIWASNCYFQVGWLFCSNASGIFQKTILGLAIPIIFGCFIVYGKYLWDLLKNGTAEQGLKGKYYYFIIIVFLALLVVPFGSSDMSYYFNAGKAMENGLNPYVQDWPNQKDFIFPVEKNIITSFSYGPIVASMFRFLYAASGGSVLMFMILWRIITLLFFIICACLLYKLIKLYKLNLTWENFFVLWFTQPLLLFEWIVNGHFDVFWLVFLLLALLFSFSKQWWLVVPCLTIGIWFKFIPIFMVPWFVLWWWQGVARDNWYKQLTQAVVGLFLGAVITYFSWLPYWTGFGVFKSVIIQSKWAVISYFAIIYYSLKPSFVLFLGDNAHWYLTRITHAVLLSVALYLVWPYVKKIIQLIVKKQKWQDLDFITAIFITMFTYLFIWQKSFWPWYGAWLLPFGIILSLKKQGSPYVRSIIGWISLSPLTFYAVWIINWMKTGNDGGNQLWFYYYFVLTVSAYPLYLIFNWRKKNYFLDSGDIEKYAPEIK
jgi:hypothetical protein